MLAEIDLLVARGRFADRADAVESAIREKLSRSRRTRLAEACEWLDPDEERALAEEGMGPPFSPIEEY